MSSLARPPDPCLVAIILIVRSRAGPRLVFHYPPNPLSENTIRPTLKGRRVSRNKSGQSRAHDSDFSDQSGATSDEDEEDNHNNTNSSLHLSGSGVLGRRTSNFGTITTTTTTTANTDDPSVPTSPATTSSQGPGGGKDALRKRGGNAGEAEGDPATAKGGGPADGDDFRHAGGQSILGLQTDVWEKLLSPPRAWHKRRFEVGINDLAFVGWPVFVREDGTWRKEKRKRKKERSRPVWEGGELGHNEDAEDVGDNPAEGDEGEDVDANGASTSDQTDPNGGDGSRGSDDKDPMTMFNVVFVLDPPLLEYSTRLREIYENIIKKFAKALKWEQARTDYVWRESQHILHIKEMAREKGISVNALHTELISQSSLARAIYTVYSSISASKISSVSLSKDVSISLQIPPLPPTPYLAGPADKAYPGLWLTTADSVTPADEPAVDENTAPHQVLAKHFALLLLDNEATILKDIEASGGALGPALARYIRCSKPTKSFAQISATSGIPLPTIQMLASHLVYWRRARAIPPLHQRDTYIVSPNCDLSKLGVATAAYQSAFPTLPSLPKMLSALSGTPRPYGSFIPSKDHKEAYFAILAWLLRGGWVTQLRTFSRIKATPEIKKTVEAAVRREEVDKYLDKAGPTVTSSERKPAGEDDDDDDDDDAASSSSSSLASQGSGDETPMPGRRDAHGELPLSHSLLDRNTPLDRSSLILMPHRASPLESRWLDEILGRVLDRLGAEAMLGGTPNSDSAAGDMGDAGSQALLKRHWPIFIKYFNGYDALEKIPVREGLKRKLVWQILSRLGSVGGQQPVELKQDEPVLVSVRHW
ncbi:hypothetical protein PHISP_03852 [Aspergillus sp. HF37]|nr:hypothetical protein PHISP_03852 [Aspergillus sp. HF37]